MEKGGDLFSNAKDDQPNIIDTNDLIYKERGECHLNPFITILSFVFENI